MVPQEVATVTNNGREAETLVNSDVILIVDDSRFIAHAYSKVLAGLGYRVMIACDGRTGIFAAESCKPSLAACGACA